MSGQFKVDTQEIRNQKSKLDQLIVECQNAKGEESEKPSEGKGPVVERLEEIGSTIQVTWDSLIALMNSTSECLGKIADLYDTSDEKQVNELNNK